MKYLQNIFIFLCIILYCFSYPISAQEHTLPSPLEKEYEAVVVDILEEKEIEIQGKNQLYQRLEMLITNGDKKGQTIFIENGNLPVSRIQEFNTGDKVLLLAVPQQDDEDAYFITDFIRRNTIFLLIALFLGLTVLVGKKQGAASIAGMIFSFVVIFTFVLPQISSGNNPVIVAIIAAIFIIPVTFYLSHGLNKKTTIALISTILTLIITGILAALFLESAKLTGFASEEAAFVEAAMPGFINMQGLLLAGIIIGVLGILDDITISQAAIVFQLHETASHLTMKELYMKAMSIGRDHIASVVNTLILVYTGAALPLLLLFINNPKPFSDVLNYEIIAEEIVRTLVASIGLIMAVPITTLLTAYIAKKYKDS